MSACKRPEKEELEQLYNEGQSLPMLAAHYKVSKKSVLNWMNHYRIPRRTQSESCLLKLQAGRGPKKQRTYAVKDAFLKQSTPESSWFTGVVASDGCIKDHLMFEISQKERELLEKCRDLVSPSRPVNTYTRKTGKEISLLTVSSKELVEDFAKLGIGRRKARTLELPQTKQSMFRHLLRGLSDGDGSIFRTSDRELGFSWSLAGSPALTKAVAEKLNELGIQARYYCYSTWASCVVKEHRSLYLLGRLLYDDVDESIYLTRKRALFQQYMRAYEGLAEG